MDKEAPGRGYLGVPEKLTGVADLEDFSLESCEDDVVLGICAQMTFVGERNEAGPEDVARAVEVGEIAAHAVGVDRRGVEAAGDPILRGGVADNVSAARMVGGDVADPVIAASADVGDIEDGWRGGKKLAGFEALNSGGEAMR